MFPRKTPHLVRCLLSARRNSPTSAWRPSMSSTRKAPRRCNPPHKLPGEAAGAAGAEAAAAAPAVPVGHAVAVVAPPCGLVVAGAAAVAAAAVCRGAVAAGAEREHFPIMLTGAGPEHPSCAGGGRLPRRYASSARFPKFVIRGGMLWHELRKRTGTSKHLILVPLYDLKFLDQIAAGGAGTSNRRH